MRFRRTKQLNPSDLPETFDLDDPNHIVLIDSIRDAFSKELMRDTGPYLGCMFKPESLLPCPASVVRRALTSMLDFAEGRRPSSLLSPSLRTEEHADLLRTCLVHLDDFLPFPAQSLPESPHENAIVGFQFKDSSA